MSARRVGPVRIGDSEDELRRALGPPQSVKRGFLRWCVEGGGRLLAGQRGDRSGELGDGGPRPTVLALTTSPAFEYRGVGAGARLRKLRRALPRARRAFSFERTAAHPARRRSRAGRRSRGRTVLYVAGRRSTVLLGVRGRHVRFLAVRDRQAVAGRRTIRGFLRRAG